MEMPIITVWNEAGGAGKSTLVAEVGYALSQRRKEDGSLSRVLLIDLDPQRTLTRRLGLLDGENAPAYRWANTIFPLFMEDSAVLPRPFPAVNLPEISVIPAHERLRMLEGSIGREKTLMSNLRRALVAVRGEFDYVLIDTPPSNGDLTQAALIAADFVVMPVPTHIKGVENFENVTRVIGECQEVNPDVKLLAFVPNSYNEQRTQDGLILEALREQYNVLAPTTHALIERSGMYRNVLLERSTVLKQLPRSEAAQDIEAVTTQLLSLMRGEALPSVELAYRVKRENRKAAVSR